MPVVVTGSGKRSAWLSIVAALARAVVRSTGSAAAGIVAQDLRGGVERMWTYEVVPSLLGGLLNGKFEVQVRRCDDEGFALDETFFHCDRVFDTEKAAIRYGRTWITARSESQARSLRYADGTRYLPMLVSSRAFACPEHTASASISCLSTDPDSVGAMLPGVTMGTVAIVGGMGVGFAAPR